MSVIRVGSTGKYAAGWENIFGGSKKSRQAAGKAAKAKTSAKPVSVKAATKDKKKTSARKKR